MEIGYFFPWYYGEWGMVNGFFASVENIIYFCTLLCPVIVGAVFWIDGTKWSTEKYELSFCFSFFHLLLLGQVLTKACEHGNKTGKFIWLCLLCSGICAVVSAFSFWLNYKEQRTRDEKMGSLKERKRCSSCGTMLGINAKFCRECGKQCEEIEIEVEKNEEIYCAYCGKKVGSCIQYCIHCGTRLEEHARYCPLCGKKVERSQE